MKRKDQEEIVNLPEKKHNSTDSPTADSEGQNIAHNFTAENNLDGLLKSSGFEGFPQQGYPPPLASVILSSSTREVSLPLLEWYAQNYPDSLKWERTTSTGETVDLLELAIPLDKTPLEAMDFIFHNVGQDARDRFYNSLRNCSDYRLKLSFIWLVYFPFSLKAQRTLPADYPQELNLFGELYCSVLKIFPNLREAYSVLQTFFGCDLYLMSEFNIEQCKEMEGNAVILTNKNTAYFIIEDRIIMKDEKPQAVEDINRQEIELSDSIKPTKYTVSEQKKEKIIKESTLKGDHIPFFNSSISVLILRYWAESDVEKILCINVTNPKFDMNRAVDTLLEHKELIGRKIEIRKAQIIMQSMIENGTFERMLFDAFGPSVPDTSIADSPSITTPPEKELKIQETAPETCERPVSPGSNAVSTFSSSSSSSFFSSVSSASQSSSSSLVTTPLPLSQNSK